jgi:hypothetical protein
MMTQSTKQAIPIAGFALLGILAVAGWTRNTAPANASNNFATPAYAANQLPAVSAQPTGFDSNGRAVYSQYYPQPAAYAPGVGQYVNANCTEPLPVQSAAYAPIYTAPDQTRYRTYSRPRVVRTYVQQDRDYVVRRNKRSTGKSVAIVAGSAGAGAAIGALAGGGKGAAIGGLAGGAAGFVYDRLTHNK